MQNQSIFFKVKRFGFLLIETIMLIDLFKPINTSYIDQNKNTTLIDPSAYDYLLQSLKWVFHVLANMNIIG